MKIVFKLTFGLAFAIVCMGCSSQINGDDTMKSYPMDMPMTDYVLPDGTDWQGLKRDTVYLFNSKDDILPYVSKANIPEIDFDQYSLMVVSGVNLSGIKNVSSLLQQTAADSYELTVSIESYLTTVVEKWSIAKLVGKLRSRTMVGLQIKNYPTKLFPIIIGEGDLNGGGREGILRQNRVISTSEAWELLKTAINTVNNETENFSEKDIDFSKYQVIAVFDEVKLNGGWSIDITSVMEYNDKIVVTISNMKKGNITAVLTQPYHIVKIPVSKKEIVFDVNYFHH